MSAIPMVKPERAALDPVIAIVLRIERARSRLRLERAEPSVYPVFDEGRLVGTIYAARRAPAFGTGAETVLLRREL